MTIDQSYINGYRSCLDTLRIRHTHELLELRQHYYQYRIIKCSEYKISRRLVLKHLKSLRNLKNSYKALVKQLNKLSATKTL